MNGEDPIQGTGEQDTPGLAPPSRLDLPCFVYGLFMPGELAFNRISGLVVAHRAAIVNGELFVRDGLPLLKLSGGCTVPGHLLNFGNLSRLAYKLISEFEPRNHYSWKTALLSSPSVEANLLEGINLDRAGADATEFGTWCTKDDPVFTEGLAEVKRVFRDVELDAGATPWTRLFRLQMAYLLLWSAIERYTALSYGPGLDPNKRIKMLGTDDLFKRALGNIRLPPKVAEAAVVFDCRDPSKKYRLSPDNPNSSAKYFYQVRSNLSHRGKGAWKDIAKVQLALATLLEVFEGMLSESVFAPRP
jgi:hypothetical protein